jgi:hypothetical protein
MTDPLHNPPDPPLERWRAGVEQRLAALEQRPPRPGDDEPDGDAPAPPPSDACHEVLELRARLKELETSNAGIYEELRQAVRHPQSRPDWTILETVASRCQLYDRLREVYGSDDPDKLAAAALIARTKEDELTKRLTQIHEWLYGLCGDRDEISTDEAMDLIAARYSLWRRLSAPKAYDVRDPAALANVALSAHAELARLTTEATAVQQLTSSLDEQDLGRLADAVDSLAALTESGELSELALFLRRLAGLGDAS